MYVNLPYDSRKICNYFHILVVAAIKMVTNYKEVAKYV